MTRSKTQPSEFDYPLLVLITVLVGFGLVMVYQRLLRLRLSGMGQLDLPFRPPVAVDRTRVLAH